MYIYIHTYIYIRAYMWDEILVMDLWIINRGSASRDVLHIQAFLASLGLVAISATMPDQMSDKMPGKKNQM